MQKKKLLKRILIKSGIDGLLVTDLVNIRYLTGFTGSSGFLFITAKDAFFVTDFRYQQQAKDEVNGFRLRFEHTERVKEIKGLFDDYGVKKLGFEDHNVSFSLYRKLLNSGVKLKPGTDSIESLRIIKSEEELSCIKKAVIRAEKAFRRLQPSIRPGTTELNLALKLGDFLKKEGCKKLPFEVIVASGSRSALPHAKPSAKTLRKGDLVVFDWGGECDGYYSDMTRTLLLNGKNIEKQKRLYYSVLEAQTRAQKAVKTGIKSSVIDKAPRGYIEDLGYGDNFGHGTGHGVGLAVHERPFISWKSKEMIKCGMVFTIEPGIYLPGFGGVRIEDMVVVRRNRAELLTGLPRRLKII